ncbi:putative peptidyl-prolyl cis-trans isomerase [Sphingobium sp. SYK-6]|uniref:peptidylprolyl isomerase n=1 Tax=Sphingobium sp. (strain NBRC 103272 / SYK-6) TaxID=627192 RepID=UPI00022776A2|nr:peptidylprolyl isomerase [Sphingobium sp. SYK-6]BAK67258.1 putative peptidyl-prolyl cis-trans isomerase [Sphingobium sp. SYK-6]
MNFFRRILKSKFGGVFAAVFLGLIALAFVSGDLTSGGMNLFGPSSAEVAKIGGRTITVNDVQTRTQMVFERMRNENPALTMDQFLAEGGLRNVASEMIAMQSLIAYGEKHGMQISKALIDAEIASNPAFVDATGNFSETVFRQMLAQQGIAEKDLREDIIASIVQRQMLAPVSAGARTPASMVPPYAAMLIEERSGEMISIPSAAFAPSTPPGDAELQAYYRSNPGQFTVPEQRKLRYATVNLSRFEAQAAPTEEELAQAYKARSQEFQARQTRDVSQLILATENAARDAAAKAKAGTPLADVARGLGLAATRMDGQDEKALASQTTPEIAKAVYAAAKDAVIGPVRSPLGWAVVRVEDVRAVPGKTLDQARPELTAEIRKSKEQQLFSAFLNDIDGKIGEGLSFAELAKAHNLTMVETPLVLKDGTALRDPAFKADATLAALLDQGFSMSADDDAQVVSVKPDEEAAILAVEDVVAEGPPPFNEVKSAVQVAWGLSKGAERARQLATQLAAELGKGADPAAVLAKLGLAQQAERQTLSVRRADINNREDGRIPPPLEALFTIKVGATRLLPLENNQGFSVVRLDKITPNDPSQVPQLLASTRAGLSNVLGGEYARQFMVAVQKELGVQRNESALAAVEKALRSANGGGE